MDIAQNRKEFKIALKPGIPGRPSHTTGTPRAKFSSDGSGITEEFVFDKPTGVKLNINMCECEKPTIPDIGPCETILVEMRPGNAVLGSTGIKHAVATTKLIVCAVANPIGRWLSPPLTPDKILRAFGKA